MDSPRPVDYLRAELARLTGLRRAALAAHAAAGTEPDHRRAIRAAYDRRIDRVLEQLHGASCG